MSKSLEFNFVDSQFPINRGHVDLLSPPELQVVSQSWPKVEGKVLEIAESLYKNLLPGGYFQISV